MVRASTLVLLLAVFSLSEVSVQQVTRVIVREPSPSRNDTPTRPGRERVEVVTGTSWDRLTKGSLTVDSKDGVSVFVISVVKGDSRFPARYNITFIIPDYPENCNPNTTLWYSPAVYYEKLCMERDWMGKCTLPGGDGFTNQQELIDNYAKFKQIVFDYKVPEFKRYQFRVQKTETKPTFTIKKELKGAFCYDDRDYWVAFSTSCPEPIEMNIEVGVKHSTVVERWTCRGFNFFMLAQQGSDAFLTSKLFWAIMVPIGYFILLTGFIFGSCYFFNCGAALKASMLLNVNLPFDIFDSDDESEDEPPHKPSKKSHRKKRKE